MKEARKIIHTAIETIEEMNKKFLQKYGYKTMEDAICPPYWCLSFGHDKITIYKECLASGIHYDMNSGIVKDALDDIAHKAHWEIALAEGRA